MQGIAQRRCDGAPVAARGFCPGKQFDVCLFSESYQYIPLAASFAKLGELLAPDGRVVIADCFRSESFGGSRAIGGGHRYSTFLAAVEGSGFAVTSNEDVTALAAPSIEIDRMLYRDVLSPVVSQLGGLLEQKRPAIHWLARRAYGLFVGAKERQRITERLRAEYRTPELFLANNTYRFMTLERRAD